MSDCWYRNVTQKSKFIGAKGSKKAIKKVALNRVTSKEEVYVWGSCLMNSWTTANVMGPIRCPLGGLEDSHFQPSTACLNRN